MSSRRLREIYISHHRDLKKYGRITGGGERVRLIRQQVGTGKRLLDLGCRDGSFTRFLLEGNDVVGADIDDVALDLCRRSLGIPAVHVDLNEDFPFANGSFDAVFAGEILEHVIAPDHFVSECRRVLRRGGVFCGTTPNAFRVKKRFAFLIGHPIDTDPTHFHYFSHALLNDQLCAYFEGVDIIPFHGHIIGSRKFGVPVSHRTPLFLGRLFSRHLLWRAVRG